MTRVRFRVMSLAPRRKCPRNVVQMKEAMASSETQGQIVGARESLSGRKNVARRKVRNGEKSSSRRSLLFFVPHIFFRPFRLSLAPSICPWFSEDEAMAAFFGSDSVAISCHCKRSKIILVKVLTEVCSLENIAPWNWRKIALAWSDSVLLTLRSLVCMWKTCRKGG